MRTSIKLVLVIMLGVGMYIIVTIAQSRAAADLCANYPVGTRIENLETLNDTFFLTLMGPIADPKRPGAHEIIFCASLTMCDTSCSLVIENGLVVQSNFSDH